MKYWNNLLLYKVFCYLYCVLFDDVLIRRREKAFSLVTHECPASIKMFYVSTVICISVRLALHCVSSCRMLMTLSALLAMKVTWLKRFDALEKAVINMGLIGMLLVSRYGLMEENVVQVFHYYGFHLLSPFLMYNFKSFQGK